MSPTAKPAADMGLWTALRHAFKAVSAVGVIDETDCLYRGALGEQNHAKMAEFAGTLAEAYDELAEHLDASRLARLAVRNRNAEVARDWALEWYDVAARARRVVDGQIETEN